MLKTNYEYIKTMWGTYTELVITHNGEEIGRHGDTGEPEDSFFGRDWSWIKPLLETVYTLGLEDGKNE